MLTQIKCNQANLCSSFLESMCIYIRHHPQNEIVPWAVGLGGLHGSYKLSALLTLLGRAIIVYPDSYFLFSVSFKLYANSHVMSWQLMLILCFIQTIYDTEYAQVLCFNYTSLSVVHYLIQSWIYNLISETVHWNELILFLALSLCTMVYF
jgi:hypothetical protein